ncbi:hypothetical protein [Pinirhizobacter sp.]|jgi:hypothetical protein|uniref:hypothetical protein n=1 Tax=Pinirhizobacter sp. TaxID=2950432 RepID=UPI002F42E4BB
MRQILRHVVLPIVLNVAYLVLCFQLTGAFGFAMALCWSIYFGLPFGKGPSVGKWMRERSRIAQFKESSR